MGSDSFDLVLAVFREPARIAEIRERPLPEDVARVIRLAAGEASALEDAVRSTGENEEKLVEASVFLSPADLVCPGRGFLSSPWRRIEQPARSPA